jgi:cation:H+ antiporter
VVHVVLLIACAVAIYLSCEWFVNAVEWLGQRLNIGSMAVGTILAAFGTALPEQPWVVRWSWRPSPTA